MDLTVRTTAFQAESRGWLWGPHGTEPGANPTITLDLTLFVAGTHYPNGYIPSGCVIAKVTATGLYGPVDAAAVDGRATAGGLLFNSENVTTGQTRASNALFVHGFVDPARCPFQSGTGGVTTAAKNALTLIYWL
jgi:hypothetical protein